MCSLLAQRVFTAVTDKEQWDAVLRYWNTLCSRYREQTDPACREKKKIQSEKTAQDQRNKRVSVRLLSDVRNTHL
jgi:hypothetical protein